MVMCVGCGSDRDEQYNGNSKVLVVMMVMITVMGLDYCNGIRDTCSTGDVHS